MGSRLAPTTPSAVPARFVAQVCVCLAYCPAALPIATAKSKGCVDLVFAFPRISPSASLTALVLRGYRALADFAFPLFSPAAPSMEIVIQTRRVQREYAYRKASAHVARIPIVPKARDAP